ncbi:MAG: aminoacyl-tRNA hydrolase [Methylococcales bacterium]|nr:aminoacyl-tRNA hydrolase [Methylococcales bacterium]MCK5924700.1 aminoacyl-tRNA hydrolase [Methylococcales bacterium]
MIKLIVGLGNPGPQYEKTRHNAGFLFLDQLVSNYSGAWRQESKFHGSLASCVINAQKILLLKPSTFMNNSGQAVNSIAHYYKITPEQILVVHDELDFIAGIIKLKKGGGHAGHNGLRDIIAHLSSKDFYRLRVGIDRPSAGKPVADYVLSKPSKIEMTAILEGFYRVDVVMATLISANIRSAMNELNTKIK